MYDNNEYMDFQFEPMDEESIPYLRPQAPKQQKKKRHRGVAVVALALSCAILGGAGGASVMYCLAAGQNTSAVSEVESVAVSDLISDNGTITTVSSTINLTEKTDLKTPKEVYAENVNCVVGITTSGVSTNAFGQMAEYASSGTGFIITEDGYIVTNNHVVEGADSVQVALYDGTVYEAVVVGTESSINDVALLKIEATGLQAATIGDSENILVGDQVAAIGNPLGELTFTQTVGYISATDRAINADGTPSNMIQTDVAINSGNSGGPLFDMYGNVIGVTTAKYSGSSGSGATIEGIGFALPINDVIDIVNDLRDFGYVTGRAFMGVSIQELDSQVARYYNLPAGVYIAAVTEGSGAEMAGLVEGDIVISMGGVETPDYDTLTDVLETYSAGDTSTVDVYRSGEEMTLTITFDEKNPNS